MDAIIFHGAFLITDVAGYCFIFRFRAPLLFSIFRLWRHAAFSEAIYQRHFDTEFARQSAASRRHIIYYGVTPDTLFLPLLRRMAMFTADFQHVTKYANVKCDVHYRSLWYRHCHVIAILLIRYYCTC